MRRLLLAAALIASGAVSLVVIAVVSPLVWAMRNDRRERNRADALRSFEPYPYDDNDPGVDVDMLDDQQRAAVMFESEHV